MIPYDETYTKEENKKFIVLHTCEKHCSNHGIFEKEEFDGILDSQNKCPFCNAEFSLSSKKQTPPFGFAALNYFYASSSLIPHTNWLKYTFILDKPPNNSGQSETTERVAFYPLTFNGIIATYLVKDAFYAGKLFKYSTSLYSGKYGVVYGNVHLRTGAHGGVHNHAYGNNPVKELDETVLKNLISECNGFDIYSPEQIIDFFPKTKKYEFLKINYLTLVDSIKKTLKKLKNI
jgi:hypothetical protein